MGIIKFNSCGMVIRKQEREKLAVAEVAERTFAKLPAVVSHSIRQAYFSRIENACQ